MRNAARPRFGRCATSVTTIAIPRNESMGRSGNSRGAGLKEPRPLLKTRGLASLPQHYQARQSNDEGNRRGVPQRVFGHLDRLSNFPCPTHTKGFVRLKGIMPVDGNTICNHTFPNRSGPSAAIAPAAITLMALTCRWGSRPQHQQRN